jgi:hypothetical protein
MARLGFPSEWCGYVWTAARARKPYACDKCGRRIPRDEVYFYKRKYSRYLWIGYADYQRVCAEHAPEVRVVDWKGRVVWKRRNTRPGPWVFGE